MTREKTVRLITYVVIAQIAFNLGVIAGMMGDSLDHHMPVFHNPTNYHCTKVPK